MMFCKQRNSIRTISLLCDWGSCAGFKCLLGRHIFSQWGLCPPFVSLYGVSKIILAIPAAKFAPSSPWVARPLWTPRLILVYPRHARPLAHTAIELVLTDALSYKGNGERARPLEKGAAAADWRTRLEAKNRRKGREGAALIIVRA